MSRARKTPVGVNRRGGERTQVGPVSGVVDEGDSHPPLGLAGSIAGHTHVYRLPPPHAMERGDPDRCDCGEERKEEAMTESINLREAIEGLASALDQRDEARKDAERLAVALERVKAHLVPSVVTVRAIKHAEEALKAHREQAP